MTNQFSKIKASHEILTKATYYYIQNLKNMGYNGKHANIIIESSNATAIEVINYFYNNDKGLDLNKTNFKSFLPFLIYELADPASGDLPEFTKAQRHFSNEVKSSRTCIIHTIEDPKICMDLVFAKTQLDHSHADKIMNAALDYLGISDLADDSNF